MPLIQHKTYSSNKELAIWKANESEEFFRQKISLNKIEEEKLASYSNSQRRKEWLGIRYILQNILKINSTINYDENGKPFLENSSLSISISHSKDLLGIYICLDISIGLDIEQIHSKVGRLSNKFINRFENKSILENNRISSSVIIWCAKEVLIKIYGEKDLDFKSNLNVLPFEVKKTGILIGQILLNDKQSDFKLTYFRLDNYFIVFGPN